MLVARIFVSKSEIETRSLAPITAGMVGAEVEVLFDSTWSGFSKTFVWSHDEVVINDLNASGRIPAEVLAKCGGLLNFGVYGTKEGEVMPTVWTAVGTVNVGTDPSGDESTDPALPAWAQLQEKIEQIKNKDSDYLTSADLDSAVADALAEAKSSGEFDGYTPLKGTDYYTQEDKSEIVAEVREAVEDTGIRNPNTLTFTGAVIGSYDGSAPLNVEIPAANDADWEFITKLTQEGTTTNY
ncbi:MAG: hypothetical protein J6C98_00020, partial [Oscillospiraceae bacterium]|nr:hypothetical protein [Oscillospiraceae bacterium]